MSDGETGTKSLDNEGERENKDKGKLGEKMCEASQGSDAATKTKGKGKLQVQKDKEKMKVSEKKKVIQNEDSDSSNMSWHDSDEDDEAIMTDDSLDDDELGSGDEYQEARQNMRQEEGRIDEIVEVEVDDSCVLYNDDREEMLSDYIDSDGEMNSDSSEDENDDDLVPRIKGGKVRYDHRCEHKDLKLCLGMRFESGWQCKEALKTT
ncbi:hypothetical protein OROMI_020124 [Orobanche minor]